MEVSRLPYLRLTNYSIVSVTDDLKSVSSDGQLMKKTYVKVFHSYNAVLSVPDVDLWGRSWGHGLNLQMV